VKIRSGAAAKTDRISGFWSLSPIRGSQLTPYEPCSDWREAAIKSGSLFSPFQVFPHVAAKAQRSAPTRKKPSGRALMNLILGRVLEFGFVFRVAAADIPAEIITRWLRRPEATSSRN
jgi:hypothetical protein